MSVGVRGCGRATAVSIDKPLNMTRRRVYRLGWVSKLCSAHNLYEARTTYLSKGTYVASLVRVAVSCNCFIM